MAGILKGRREEVKGIQRVPGSLLILSLGHFLPQFLFRRRFILIKGSKGALYRVKRCATSPFFEREKEGQKVLYRGSKGPLINLFGGGIKIERRNHLKKVSKESPYPFQMEAVTAPAPPAAPPAAFECCVCYEDGATTGKITLACNHDICLGCFTTMCGTPGYWGTRQTAHKCPMCRAVVNMAGTTPGPTPGPTEEQIQVQISYEQQIGRQLMTLRRNREDVERARRIATEAEAAVVRTATRALEYRTANNISTARVPRVDPEQEPALTIAAEAAVRAMAEAARAPTGAAQPVRVNMGEAIAMEEAYNAQQRTAAAAAAAQRTATAAAIAAEHHAHGIHCPGCRQVARGTRQRRLWRPDSMETTRLLRCDNCLRENIRAHNVSVERMRQQGLQV